MARRQNTQAADEQQTATPEVEERTTTEVAEAPAEAKAEDKPVDLSAFESAVAEALGTADESTGEVPAAGLEAVNKAYRDLDGIKAKNQARARLDEEMKKAIIGKNITAARSYVNLKDNLSAGSGGGGVKAPADPTEAFVQKVAALQIALTLTGTSVPEGVEDDWSSRVESLIGELESQVDAYAAYEASDDEDAEAPEVSPVVRQAFKLSAGRVSGGARVAGGPRRDIEQHLVQIFADKPVGTFMTVAEIAKTKSTEYGDDRPSAGAVSARLFPKDKEPYSGNGLEATAPSDGSARGATKVA